MHFNNQLCNTAWKKKICLLRIYLFFKGVRRCRGQVWRKLRSVRVFVPKTVTVIFFGALAKEWQLEYKTNSLITTLQ